jgi:ubiquinone/menaquinone biosynthesis C-methylase UbiE
MNGDGGTDGVTDRQARERAYHEQFASEHAEKVNLPVLVDIIDPGHRRPWNAVWAAYDRLMEEKLAGKRVLVPGCGFGDDAIRLALLGADVHAGDLSPDLIEIAAQRSRLMNTAVQFAVNTAENSSYPDNFFDLIYFSDVLHHADIPATITEARRVLKPDGRVVVNELYTHSATQKLRNNFFVEKVVYPRMVRFIYGTCKPYITEDEHKIDQHELAIVESLVSDKRLDFYLLVGGRVLPKDWPAVAKTDRFVLRQSQWLGRLLASRLVMTGTVVK